MEKKYALTYEIINNKKTNKPVYKFSTFNSNMSSGQKTRRNSMF